ncbi:NADPH-dependent FMN reductase [Levilactobacillus andaensis]|uniref:NADPH-dependent FMN reductase n=1 Tax=Levilactobacillus andaensis TaxID=2799570 RepID=UPI001944FA0A|nr:NADPH-dependent FMN reductase [Levilactobacillus andaensis]
MTNIGILVGSLSQKSYSQKIANHLMKIQLSAKFVQVNYEILPLYNPDLEQTPILEWQIFRSVIDHMDALVFVTPEYNFSIPGGLKNALDVLSVPLPPSHIVHKPALVITDSSGERGGANANAHIQQLLRYMGMNVRNDFITIGKVQESFDDQDRLLNQQVSKELNEAIKNFVDMIELQNN